MKYIDINGEELSVVHNDYAIKYHNSNGEFHRLDGPAIIWRDGIWIFYYKNKQHRIGGPAIYIPPLSSLPIVGFYWYINNKQVNIYYICG